MKPMKRGRLLRIVAMIAGLLSCAVQAQAQANPDLERLLVSSPVIVPASAPGACLDMDLNGQGLIIIIWSCTANWNQAFRFKDAAVLGDDGPIQGAIWLGGQGCLTNLGVGTEYAYVQMKPCTGASNQIWTMQGGQIRSPDGRCLALSDGNARNGSPVYAYQCRNDQKFMWRLSMSDIEVPYVFKREGWAYDPNPSDAEIVRQLLPKLAVQSLEALTERDRPKIVPRKLTAAERAELAKLGAPYIGHGAEVKLPYSTLTRLSELASSGDRDAMATLLRAFASEVWDKNFVWSEYDTVDDGGAFAGGDGRFARQRLDRLFALWSAEYWARFGKSREAAFGISGCPGWRIETRCGYLYDVSKKDAGKNPYHWWRTGKGEDFVDFKNIRFYSLVEEHAVRQARFEQGLKTLAFSWYGSAPKIGDEELGWLAGYAVETGQARYFRGALLHLRRELGRIGSPIEKALALDAQRTNRQARWDELWAKSSLTNVEQITLESIATETYQLPLYLTRYRLVQWANIERYCTAGFAEYCKIVEDNLARGRAERAAVANFFTGSPQSQTVTVRNYDQNGNFLGTTVDTRTGAELSGAKPQQ